MTQVLLQNGFKVVAVEFDDRWIAHLNEKFSNYVDDQKLFLIHADATTVDLDTVTEHLESQKALLCGNLPYNRGQEIVLRFFEHAPFATAFVVMLQKEVADKFLPRSERKTYGPLSIKLNFLAKNLESFPVSAGSFSPPPKVESSVLSFMRQDDSQFDPLLFPENYKHFSNFLRKAFAQRRKKLSNNIGHENTFPETHKHFAGKRAEELTPDEHLSLWNAFTKT